MEGRQPKGKKNITVRLNTVGGDATVGLFICNKLKALKENGTKIKVIVDGLAASAGSIIMCAGDTISVYSNSMIMIHEAKSGICGYYSAADLKKVENGIKAYNDMIVATYGITTRNFWRVVNQIRREIAEIENRGLRASRAVALGIATEEDLNKLQEIESAIAELRAEYEAL